jgi:hypothetical protein
MSVSRPPAPSCFIDPRTFWEERLMRRPFACVLLAASLLLPGCVGAEVAGTAYTAGPGGPHPKTLQIAEAEGGRRISVALAGLTVQTVVRRAHLVARRGELKDGADLLKEIEIYAGPTAAGKPLELIAPLADRFDATAAVRAALQRGKLTFFVRTFPGWEPETTRLEILFESETRPDGTPPPVTGLRVAHRAGQTFLTWREVDPPVTADNLTWGEYRKALAKAADACRYRIYVHDRPITAKNLTEARLLAEVGPLSCWNTNGRNTETLIGQAMVQPDEIGELARHHNHEIYSWHMNHPRMDRYELDRLVIDEKAGPLPPGTGLYVHLPRTPGRRCYAVVACRYGVENTRDLSAANALARPLKETVGPGRPVHQGPGLWGPYFDYPGRRQVYVQWCGPPLAPRQNMYFNWTVLAPPGREPGEKAPVELYFHSGNYTYAKPLKKFLKNSIQFATHDWPPSGWYGFNSAYNTLRSYRAGTVDNHTQKRILAFLEWARGTWPLDTDRILVPGSDGAALLALNHPDRFAYVLINKFSNDVLRRPEKFIPAWGPKSPEVKDVGGRANWDWAMLDKVVRADRSRDLPFFFCRGYSWGPHVRGFAKGEGRFYDAMLEMNQPIMADWTWASGKLIPPDEYTGRWRGLDLTCTTPVPAFANCSLDANRESNGNVNLPLSWEPVKETGDSVACVVHSGREATFDLAFRRLQQFRARPGETLKWSATNSATRRIPKPEPQGGTVPVGKDGLFVLKKLKVNSHARLTVTVTRAK